MKITAADQFCGAGGFSTGLRWAIADIEKEQGKPIHLRLVAINHWPVAIATHKANHPDVDHICDELEKADPNKLFPDGKLRLLISSPECTHFSNALGGKPRNWQSRATSKYIIKWASLLDVRDIIIENVREFRTWGPLYRSGIKVGQPIANRKGQFFRAFCRKLEALGYRVEHRLLMCADYGDPTSRTRLFIRARKGGLPIHWPSATHAHRDNVAKMSKAFGRPMKPYHTAREIIEWDDLGKSIFNREKPLADNTLRRIYAGLAKFSGLPFLVPFHKEREGQSPRTHSVDVPLPTIATQRTPVLVQPYLVKLYNTSDAASVDRPVPTITANGQHIGLAQAFVIGQQSGAAPRSVEEPLPTVAGAGAISLIQPFLFHMDHSQQGDRPLSVDEPMRTVTSADSWGLAQPFVFAMEHSTDDSGHDRRVFHPDGPMPTLSARAAFGLASPFVLSIRGGDDKYTRGSGVDEPLHAITAHPAMALVQPSGFIVPVNHGADKRSHSLEEPMKTITSVDAWAMATPYLVKFYGTANDGQAVSEPLGTVTGKERFALCVPLVSGYALLDIYFRMLKPMELARAHSLGHYTFVGSREKVVKQIGNGVPSMTAKHLCYSALKF